MKKWKKLVINRKYGIITVSIPVSLFYFSGYDPSENYEYNLRFDKDRRCFIVRLRRKKNEGQNTD